MDRLKALVREPALLIDAFESLVVVLVAWGFLGLTGDQQTVTVGLFIAVLAVVKGVLTHPFPVTVIPDLGRAALVFCASLGIIHVTPDKITLFVTFLGTVMTLIQRGQITPRGDSVARPGGAGSGPIAGRRNSDAGFMDLGLLGAILAVVGLVLVVVGLLTVYNTVVLGVILFVLGVVLYVFAGHRSRSRV